MNNKLIRLMVALSVLALPALVQAQLTYTINGGYVTITGYNTNAGPNVVIPATIGGYTVIEIASSAFFNDASITSVIIPASVTSIGDSAFQDCTSLTNITIPNSVTSIGINAFFECTSLTSVTIPASVTIIGGSAFQDCTSLTSITVSASNPDYSSLGGVLFDKPQATLIQFPGGLGGSYAIPASVTNIAYLAFYDCQTLTSVTIPNSVTTIAESVFAGCTSLTSVTIPNSVSTIGDLAFYGDASLTSVTIGNGVISIGEAAFENCFGLTNVMIPDSVISIGDEAFEDTSLTSVTIPASVTSIDYSFLGCFLLTNITVDAANPAYSSLGGVLFDKLQATLIKFPEGLVESYAVPASVTSIENYAFDGCNYLTSVSIPASVSSIGEDAFADCVSLTSVSISANVTSIGDDAFGGCAGLTSVTIGSGVTSIGRDAFAVTGITKVTIPASVTSIGDYAFASCSSLTNAYFLGNAPPDDGTVFSSDPATVYYQPGATGWGSTFGGVPAVLLAPFNYTVNGGNATITGYNPSFGPSVVIPATINGDPVTSIAASAFAGTSITSVTIPASVTTIGDNAFQNCTNLTSASIGNGVTSIGQQAFANCPSLTSLTIGNSVTTIGYEAFYFDTNLTSVTIPPSVTTIASAAFYDCTRLTSAYFQGNAPVPDDATVFGGFPASDPTTAYYLPGTTGWSSPYDGVPAVLWIPFTYTVNGGDVTINGYTDYAAGGNVVVPVSINGDPVTGIAASAFYGDASLTSVSIPASVTSIGPEAFGDCSSLTSIAVDPSNPDYSSVGGALFDKAQAALIQYPGGVGGSYTIPASVTTIGQEAFFGDATITSVSIPASVTSIGSEAFADCPGLTSIAVDPSNPDYSSLNGVLFDKVQATLIQYPGGVGGSYAVPASVSSIGAYAFADCAGLTYVAISGSVTGIGQDAFYGDTSLTTVTIPASVTSIGDAAFADCPSLASAYFQGNAPPDDGTVFSGDPATVYYPPGVTGWSSTFGGVPAVLLNPFTYTTSGGAVTITGYNPASGPNVIIPVSISGYPVTSVGELAFSGATITGVTIPASVTSIADYAFAECTSLTSVTIGNGVTSIGNSAFTYCTNLTTVTIPASVTGIADYAFDECYSLKSAYFLGNAPPDDGTIFTADPTTVYYLLGTMGWGPTFGSVPAVLWNPQANTLSFTGGQFGFNLTGPANATIVVEACASLSHPVWQTIATLTLSSLGTSTFTDSQAAGYPIRFYRFRSP